MSCPSYFEKSRTDSYSCNNMTPSSIYPSHDMTNNEVQCVNLNKEYWENGTCVSTFNEMIYPDGKYSEEGFNNSVSDYNYMF